jgi:hypothetical protein
MSDEDEFDPQQSEEFKALTQKGISTLHQSKGLQTHKRYKTVYIAFKRYLIKFCPEFLNDKDNNTVKFEDFNINPPVTFFPWFGCLHEFFTSRQIDSRKNNADALVHRKSLAMVLTCVNHIYKSKGSVHPVVELNKCKEFVQGHANEVGTKRKNCE